MMTKKEEKIFDNIQEAILVECSIQCQKCKKILKEYNIDDYSFAEKLISKGWTVKRNKVLCDECSQQIKFN